LDELDPILLFYSLTGG